MTRPKKSYVPVNKWTSSGEPRLERSDKRSSAKIIYCILLKLTHEYNLLIMSLRSSALSSAQVPHPSPTPTPKSQSPNPTGKPYPW